MIQTPTYQRLQKDFTTFISMKNYAGKPSIYTSPTRDLLLWLEQKGITNIVEVDNKKIQEYYLLLTLRPLQRGKGTLAQSTINGHVKALRIFFDYLMERDVIQSGFHFPKVGRTEGKQREILSEEEIQELYKACKNKMETALLSVAYGCGLRRDEIHKLNTQDIQFSAGILIVVKGKNIKRREIPMNDRVVKDLKNYFINERPQHLKDHRKHEPSFFVNQKGKRMGGEHLNRILKSIVQRTNNDAITNKEITLHCLRHSIATHLCERGAGIEFVRDFLGHELITTSHLYAIRRKRSLASRMI